MSSETFCFESGQPFWLKPFWLKLKRCVARAHNEFLCRVSIFANKTDATTRMAGDRSAVRVVQGHPWTQTTLSEMAPGSSPVSAVSSAVEWFRSTRASRGSLGSTSWNWEGWSVWSTKQSTVHSRSCNLCGTSASGAVGNSVDSPRGHWTRSHHACRWC